MGYSAPKPIDQIDFPSTGQPSGRQWGSFFRNGKYYQILATSTNPFGNSLSAFSSVDGTTWTKLDEASQPSGTRGGPGCYWDGSSATVAVVFESFTDSVIRFTEFDLETETWGAVSGDGPAGSILPLGLYRRSDNSYITLLISDPIYLSAVTFDGSTWGTPFDVAANMRALSGYDPDDTDLRGPTAVLDDADRLHVFWGNDSFAVDWDNRYFYQAIEADNSLGQFTDFGNSDLADTSDVLLTGPPGGAPVIVDGNLIWGVYRNQIFGVDAAQFAAIYIGTPLSAPAFTPTGPIDPTGAAIASPAAKLGDYPTMQLIGGILYGTFIRANIDGVPSQIVQAVNAGPDYTTGWTSSLLLDYLVTPLSPEPDPGYLICSPILSQDDEGVVNGYGFGVQLAAFEPIPMPEFWFAGNVVLVPNYVRVPRWVAVN